MGVARRVEWGIRVGVGDSVSKLFGSVGCIERRRRCGDRTAVGEKFDCHVDTFAAGGRYVNAVALVVLAGRPDVPTIDAMG